MVFYTGFAPVAGEQIAVSYRTIGRAVGRAVNTASQQALAAGGIARGGGVDRLGHQPAGAQLRGLPQCGAGDGAGSGQRERAVERHLQGKQVSFATDVWPGDALLLNAPSTNLNAQVVVRTVKVSYQRKLSRSWWSMRSPLPMTGPTIWPSRPARRCRPMRGFRLPIAPTVLANLNGLTVTALTGSTVTVNANVTPPTGGGFEIRLRDFAFMAGEDPTW